MVFSLSISSSTKVERVKLNGFKKAFTLIELLVVISIIFLLMGLVFPVLSFVRAKGYQILCQSNIRQLVFANTNYAQENQGFFCPGSVDPYTGNLHRWFGIRDSTDNPFNLTKGPLAEYVNLKKIACPVGCDASKRDPSEPDYDDGSGGYGYNMIYIGSRIWQLDYEVEACTVTTKESEIRSPVETLMFADTAMVKAGFYIEYSFAEPRYFLVEGLYDYVWDPNPSIHFRHRKRASIAWADGHITPEKIADCPLVNEYGFRPCDFDVGWFEPLDNTMFDLE